MKRLIGYGCPLAILILIMGIEKASAAEAAPQRTAEKPCLTIFAASIERLLAAGGIVFETVDRPDLSKTLNDHWGIDRYFAGIDHSKPLGVMTTWDEESPASIIFMPVAQIDDLLKSATFGVVGFHQVSPDQYEIERPGSPYHVLVRNDYALFADALSTMRAMRATPDQLTRGLRDPYDIVVQADLLQIPRSTKDRLTTEIRAQTEPWLQPRDDEASELANLRRVLGKLVLEIVDRVILDTKSVTFGVRIDPKSKHLVADFTIEASERSQLAAGLNRLEANRSQLHSLLQDDVTAGLGFNLPIGYLIEKILGAEDRPSAKSSSLDVAFQLVGDQPGDFTMIFALRGSDTDRINDSMPEFIAKLEDSERFALIKQNSQIHRGVVFHELVPRMTPIFLMQWIGHDTEVIIGQGKHVIWTGIGSQGTLFDRISDAIDTTEDTPAVVEKRKLVRGRIQGSKLPEVIASTPLIPSVDIKTTREELQRGEDGFSLLIEPVKDGIRIRIEAEQGFLRLFGREWVRQIEGVNSSE